MMFDTPIDVRQLLAGNDNQVQNDTSEFTLDQIASRLLYELDENQELTPKEQVYLAIRKSGKLKPDDKKVCFSAVKTYHAPFAALCALVPTLRRSYTQTPLFHFRNGSGTCTNRCTSW